jgi:Mn-dependent DtxR family transcriptional regulator
MDIVKKLRARQAYPLDGAGQLLNPDGPEAAEEIIKLRRIIWNLLDDGDEADRTSALAALKDGE